MNKKNLILFMPTIEVGGVEKNFLLISNFFSKRLRNVSVITTSYDFKYKFKKNIKFISLKKLYIRNFSRRIKFFLALFLLFLELIKNKNNVVFAFQANFYCIILCKILRTKIVIRSNSSPYGWSKNKIKLFLYRLVLSFADLIIVNSLKFKYILFKKFNVRSVCIYNPLDKKNILSKARKNINVPFFKKKFFKFINVARLEDQKDHVTLIKAFSMLNKKIKFRLLIIGNGKNKKILENLICDYNLNKHIKIIDFKRNPYPFIKNSDVFVLSSKFEGLPNVLLESLVLNKFVISSNCSTGPSEILDNGKGGLLFQIQNPKELKNKIIYFLKNRSKCKKKLNFAIKRLKRFDYDKNMEKYYNVINSFL